MRAWGGGIIGTPCVLSGLCLGTCPNKGQVQCARHVYTPQNAGRMLSWCCSRNAPADEKWVVLGAGWVWDVQVCLLWRVLLWFLNWQVPAPPFSEGVLCPRRLAQSDILGAVLLALQESTIYCLHEPSPMCICGSFIATVLVIEQREDNSSNPAPTMARKKCAIFRLQRSRELCKGSPAQCNIDQ